MSQVKAVPTHCELDFATGKLPDVARRRGPGRRREYAWLAGLTATTSIPYVVFMAFRPGAASLVILGVAFFKVAMAFAASARTDTAHHVRFLLAGCNPIGMTGGSSLLLAAVDSILDWREDAGERKAHPARYWLKTAANFFTTPIGLVMLAAEFAWDVLLLRRGPRLPRYKWSEFFSLAYYHDLICPEKSNDIFYADRAYARYQEDVYLYQWHRMRALVFELQHYRLDVEHGWGVAETNLFRQDEITAFQTLKRLQVERIEDALEAHYGEHPDAFPIPRQLGRQLVANARPLEHYIRMRGELAQRLDDTPSLAFERELRKLLCGCEPAGEPTNGRRKGPCNYFAWHVLRLLEEDTDEFSARLCPRYLTDQKWRAMVDAGVLEVVGDPGGAAAFRFRARFQRDWNAFLVKHFRLATPAEADEVRLHGLPTLLCYRGRDYLPADATNPQAQAPATCTNCPLP